MTSMVSVIIPTYNREKSIIGAIDSVLAQTYPHDFEVIVVDDGSKDRTEDVVARYGERVRFVRKANGGPASARNEGAARARGEWLAFLDSDDTWHAEKLERQLRFVIELGLNVCFHDLRAIRLETGAETPSWNRWLAIDRHWPHPVKSGAMEDPLDLITQGGDLLFTSTFLVKRAIFDKWGRYDVQMPMCEDIDFYLRLAEKETLGFLDEPLATRGWASNWAADQSYLWRIEAICRSRKRALETGNKQWAHQAQRALGLELRRLGGLYRKTGKPWKATKSYVDSLLALTGRMPRRNFRSV